MANLNLSQQDIDFIARVVDTEVPPSLARTAPEAYSSMVQAVVDTIVNRVASPGYPNTVQAVVDQHRQFSKITGPKNLDPYGAVKNTPKAPVSVFNMVKDHVVARANGMPSPIGKHVNYANPNYSTPNNMGWINAMAAQPSSKTLGVGNAIHVHGTAKGARQPGDFVVSAPGAIGNPQQMNAKNIGYSVTPNKAAIPSLGVDGVNSFRNAAVPSFAPADRPGTEAGMAVSRAPMPSAPVQTSRENLGADRINRSAYSEYGSSRMAAPRSPANVSPVSVPNVHSNFDSAGRFTGQSKPAASSLPSDMAAQYASYRPGTVPSKPATAVTSKAISPKDAYAQYAASMAAAPGRNLTSLAAALPDDPVPVAAKKTTLDEQLAEEERISRPKVAKDLARVERFNPNRKSAANMLTNAVVRTPAYQLFAALTGKPTDAKAGGLLGSLMGGLSGVAGELGAPIGSNYTGGWTPAAGGNQISASPIGVGLGGESLRGVQNQYGATSMLGEGGSRTYGGPGGSSGK